MDKPDITERLRKSFKSPHGVVVVSPLLLQEAIDEIVRLRGTELRADDEAKKLRIYLNRNVEMSPNKKAAQAVHAALIAMNAHPGTKVIVLDKGPTAMKEMRVKVVDAGVTEVAPGTLTAATNWPEDSEP